ncbi:hypothetical protein D9M73_117180 [compost metagenome]
MRHGQVRHHVVDVRNGVQNRFALFPDGQRLAVHLPGLAGAFLNVGQLAQRLGGHPAAGQLAVDLGAGAAHRGGGNLHIARLLQP